MHHNRRTFIQTGMALACGLAAPSILQAQERTRVRVGYLQTPAVDGQIWIGQHIGAFEKQGLDLQMIPFTTGLELFQAMIGGSLDVLSTGAVVSNFPARGQGKVFLVNNIEYATAQLWVSEDIKSLEDLRGKKISTAMGTTAHVFLDTALRQAGMDPAKDVQLVNQRMGEAVTSFISGAVPAVALWVPFDVTVRDKARNAHKLLDASEFYPQAAILGGWAARNEFYEKNQPVIRKLIRAWAEANDYLLAEPDAAVAYLQKNHYPQVPLADLSEQMKASKYFTAAQWREMYADGTAEKWLQQVSDFFARTGGISSPTPASTYFDPTLFLEEVQS